MDVQYYSHIKDKTVNVIVLHFKEQVKMEKLQLFLALIINHLCVQLDNV